MSEEDTLLGREAKTSARHFLGTENLGVSGNSNRAIKWFMDETDADHLCLCNDDLHVLGDFVSFYQRGHVDLDVGMFCFCPHGGVYDHDSYKWVTVRSRGYSIRLMPRMTGIMISITRKLIEKVGYFDTRFGKFGEEHCDYTYRCRFAGGIRLDGQDQGCLDLEPAVARERSAQAPGDRNVHQWPGARQSGPGRVRRCELAASRYTLRALLQPILAQAQCRWPARSASTRASRSTDLKRIRQVAPAVACVVKADETKLGILRSWRVSCRSTGPRGRKAGAQRSAARHWRGRDKPSARRRGATACVGRRRGRRSKRGSRDRGTAKSGSSGPPNEVIL
jgi:hypothetical protein